MLNVLVVEQQQKQVQYLELLKQHEAEAAAKAAKASTSQQKEPKESLPQQQQEIVDLTVSKNKEENHRAHETSLPTTSTEEKVQSETWIAKQKNPLKWLSIDLISFIHNSSMYSSMASSLKTSLIFDTHLVSIFFGKNWVFWGGLWGVLATWVKHANWEDKLVLECVFCSVLASYLYMVYINFYGLGLTKWYFALKLYVWSTFVIVYNGWVTLPFPAVVVVLSSGVVSWSVSDTWFSFVSFSILSVLGGWLEGTSGLTNSRTMEGVLEPWSWRTFLAEFSSVISGVSNAGFSPLSQ